MKQIKWLTADYGKKTRSEKMIFRFRPGVRAALGRYAVLEGVNVNDVVETLLLRDKPLNDMYERGKHQYDTRQKTSQKKALGRTKATRTASAKIETRRQRVNPKAAADIQAIIHPPKPVRTFSIGDVVTYVLLTASVVLNVAILVLR